MPGPLDPEAPLITAAKKYVALWEAPMPEGILDVIAIYREMDEASKALADALHTWEGAE